MIFNDERPRTFSEFKGQEVVVKSIQKQAIRNKFMNVYIFGGQYGGGKTSMARMVSLVANCDCDKNGDPELDSDIARNIISGVCEDYMEVDGASKNGIDEIRKLIDSVSYPPRYLKKKIYIIDEVHRISKQAFDALLKTLEEPPEYCIFILCTTDLRAIPLTVRSRAAGYTFKKIPNEKIYEKLYRICESRGFEFDTDGLRAIACNADGSMRNAESILEQSIVFGDKVTEEVVRELLGIADSTTTFRLLEHILSGQLQSAVAYLDEVIDLGADMLYLIDDMLEMITDMFLFQSGSSLSEKAETYSAWIKQLVEGVTSKRLVTVSEKFMELRDSIRQNPDRTVFVISIVSLCAKMADSNDIRIQQLMNRVDELEARNYTGQAATKLPAEDEISTKETAQDTGFVNVPADEIVAFEEKNNLSPETDSTELEPELHEQQSNISRQKEADSEVFGSELFSFTSFGADIFGNLDIFGNNEPINSNESHADLTKSNEEDAVEKSDLPEGTDTISEVTLDKNDFTEASKETFSKVNKMVEEHPEYYVIVNELSHPEQREDGIVYVTQYSPINSILEAAFAIYEIPAKTEFCA